MHCKAQGLTFLVAVQRGLNTQPESRVKSREVNASGVELEPKSDQIWVKPAGECLSITSVEGIF